MHITDLAEHAKRLAEFFEKDLGYARASNPHFEVHPTELRFYIHAYDDFQLKLDGSRRFQEGMLWCYSDRFDVAKVWDWASNLRRRPYRELRTMLAVAGEAAEIREALATAAGREFADRIIENRQRYAGLLEDL